MKPLMLAVALVTAAALVVASAVAVRLAGTDAGPGSPQTPDTGEVRDPPFIDVLWSRTNEDVVVTFTRVDSPTPLDCRWFVVVVNATGYWRDWTNLTDPRAWSDHPYCVHVPGWTTDPDLVFTDVDGDRNLSAGDVLVIRSVAPGEEAGLTLAIQYWGPWMYQFRWTDETG